MIAFSLLDSAAWAPGLASEADWLAWARSPGLPRGEQAPALAEVPAMQRRRIERLGRMAIQVALWCDAAPGTPLVFASRHGDVARSLALLESLADAEPLSPTGFSLSVHNAIAALHSILRNERGNYLALAAGEATMEAACIEAVALLGDGAREVRVVAYDAPLPDAYAVHVDAPEAFHACCWRIAAEGGQRLRLSWQDAAAQAMAADAGPLPSALAAHRFALSADATFARVAESRRWLWQRHG